MKMWFESRDFTHGPWIIDLKVRHQQPTGTKTEYKKKQIIKFQERSGMTSFVPPRSNLPVLRFLILRGRESRADFPRTFRKIYAKFTKNWWNKLQNFF